MAAKFFVIAALVALFSLITAHITYSNHPQTRNAISDHPSYVKAAQKAQIPLQPTSQPESARRFSVSDGDPGYLITSGISKTTWDYRSDHDSDEEPSLIYDWYAPKHILNSPHARCLYKVFSPGHVLHDQTISASSGCFWVGGVTTSYFPRNSLHPSEDVYVAGDKTIGLCNGFALSTQDFACQHTYIGLDGSVRFMPTHSPLDGLNSLGHGSGWQLKDGLITFPVSGDTGKSSI